jgi:hypothetical protein
MSVPTAIPTPSESLTLRAPVAWAATEQGVSNGSARLYTATPSESHASHAPVLGAVTGVMLTFQLFSAAISTPSESYKLRTLTIWDANWTCYNPHHSPAVKSAYCTHLMASRTLATKSHFPANRTRKLNVVTRLSLKKKKISMCYHKILVILPLLVFRLS